MKNCVKKLAITGALTVITMLTITLASNAATVKVTGDTLNIRKKPSTDSDVVAMLFKGVECELLEEAGDWYKIKYQNYTGYISKQYSKVLEEKTKENTVTKTTDKTESTTKIEKTENVNKTESTNKAENTEKTENTSKTETTDKTPKNEETQEITYKKLNKKVNAKILPLIYGNEIGQLKKDEEVILLSEITGWSYVQATNISGWVRTENLDNVKKQQASSNKEEKTESKDNENNTQKTAYVNESYVNVRNGAGTSYKVIKTLTLNSKVTITGEENGWYKVKSGSDEGYILKELLSDSQKTTSRANQTNRTESKNIEETKTNKNVETVKKEENTPKQETTKKEETTTKQETASKNTIKDTDIIAYAKKFLGHKYVYGGNGSDGTFDCSGFTMYVYKHFGINLPHGATSQYNSGKGTKIKKESELKAGDIVLLTDYETGVGVGHCGIYIGDGKFIHASTTTYSVIISSLKTTYAGRFYAGLRLI